MAAGEDGEHTRFPCLAMVRYAVATVVTVLAAAVVVMAIHAVLRSEDVHLSIDYGYIEADGLWSVTEAYGADELPLARADVTDVTQVNIQPNVGTSPGGEQAVSEAAAAAVAHTATSSANGADELPVQQSNYNPQTDVGAGSGAGAAAIGNRAAVVAPTPTSSNRSGSTHTSSSSDSIFTVEKKPEVDVQQYLRLRVILSAHNPGGRSKIDCNKTTIRVLDMRNAYHEIVNFELDDFTVPQQTAHTQTNWRVVNDDTDVAVLDYIKKHYHGETSFRVMVQVDAIITSYPLGRKTNSNNQTYFCWPVTVGLIAYGTLPYTDDVACKTREETQLRVGPLPAPAPMGSQAS